MFTAVEVFGRAWEGYGHYRGIAGAVCSIFNK